MSLSKASANESGADSAAGASHACNCSLPNGVRLDIPGILAYVSGPRTYTETIGQARRPFYMRMQRLTPVLVVEAIEPVLEFWVNRLGFTKTTEVPHEDRLGFVILERDGIQIMYQSVESVAADLPPLAKSPLRGSFLFIVVDDLNTIEKALTGIRPVVPRRKTFYGSEELVVREPAGNAVTFAQFA